MYQPTVSRSLKSTIEDASDEEYDPFNQTASSQDLQHTAIIKQKKFVIFECMIDELLTMVRCTKCNLSLQEVKNHSMGSNLHSEIKC